MTVTIPSQKFTHNGIVNERVNFIPAETINCDPPYVEGQIDGCWVKYHTRPKTHAEWEKLIGMKLLKSPLDKVL